MEHLAWPGAAVIVATVFIFVFRQQIGALIGRATSWKWPGGGVETPPQPPEKAVAAQKEMPEKPELPARVVIPGGPPPDPMLDPLEEDLRRRIADDYPGNHELQMKWALRLYSRAAVERHYEGVYRIIFDSQIYALKELNIRGWLTVAQAKSIYDRAAIANPEIYSHFGFEPWGSFLINHGLVALAENPPNPETKITLTPVGKGFLMFVAEKGLIEAKAG